MKKQFKDYKDLDIWQKAFKFGLMIFKMAKRISNDSSNKVLINQILRSVTSIAGNIAEGSAAATKREFINYMNNARKSAIETDNWLEFIYKTNKFSADAMGLLNEKSKEIIKILTAIIKKSKSK